ncbi:hypothetical protein C6366_18635, partial [Desulfonatronum sp. SC1]
RIIYRTYNQVRPKVYFRGIFPVYVNCTTVFTPIVVNYSYSISAAENGYAGCVALPGGPENLIEMRNGEFNFFTGANVDVATKVYNRIWVNGDIHVVSGGAIVLIPHLKAHVS